MLRNLDCSTLVLRDVRQLKCNVTVRQAFRRLAESLVDATGRVCLRGFKHFLAAHPDDGPFAVPTGRRQTDTASLRLKGRKHKPHPEQVLSGKKVRRSLRRVRHWQTLQRGGRLLARLFPRFGGAMSRSPQEALKAHIEAVNSGSMKDILADYADEAVIITADGVAEGSAEVKGFFIGALQMLPHVAIDARLAVHNGDIALVHWSAASPAGKINDGVDTFVFKDGTIHVQKVSFTVESS
jgi:hypothetical protein